MVELMGSCNYQLRLQQKLKSHGYLISRVKSKLYFEQSRVPAVDKRWTEMALLFSAPPGYFPGARSLHAAHDIVPCT